MRITSLRLHNFKGIQEIALTPNGHDLSIYGDNESGKTTIADAVFWLFFGKDSLNQSDFEIKTIDRATGEVQHRLIHSVEGEFALDNGRRLILKREYTEKWTTKRGSATEEFSGHTTTYWLNGVPVQQKEYDAAISEICPEQRFRLLTDPRHFNANLEWRDRLKILLALADDVSEADVLAAMPEGPELQAALDGRTVEGFRKYVATQRPLIAKSLDNIPHRIDELKRAMGTFADAQLIDTAALESELRRLRDEHTRLQSGGIPAELLTGVEIAQREATEAQMEFSRVSEAERAASEALRIRRETLLTQKLPGLRDIGARLMAERERLLSAYATLQRSEFDAGDGTCPTCHQALPADDIAASRGRFNVQKAEGLEALVAQGKQVAAQIADNNAAIAECEAEVLRLDAEIENRDVSAVTRAQAALDAAIERHATATQELEQAKLRFGNTDAAAAIAEQVVAVERQISAANRSNAAVAERAKLSERIAELEAEHRSLAQQHESLTRQLFLCDQFSRAQKRLLTDRINSKFSLATFRLFEEQVNGGIAEVCETTVDGVPYNSLNNAMRVNVGLDIINTLSEHYGFAPFVIVDNAESITSILPTRGQQIRLIVSEPDKALRFEHIGGKQ